MKFDLGEEVMTQGIANMLNDWSVCDELLNAINRYKNGDWGDLCEDDKALNDEAVQTNNGRILASYKTSKGKVWIITDFCPPQNITTILLPEEY